MQNRTPVYELAIKWLQQLQDNDLDLTKWSNHEIDDQCKSLGFEMGGEQAFEQQYGTAAFDCNQLKKIIDTVDDIDLLGSAIYSKWKKSTTQWDTFNSEQHTWFLFALERLAELTETKSVVFEGIAQKIQIVSYQGYNMFHTNCDDIVEQRITINTEGRVWYSGYRYKTDGITLEKTEVKNWKIEKTAATKIMSIIVAYFRNYEEEWLLTDSGRWKMKITNKDGIVFDFFGYWYGSYLVEQVDICNLIREELNMDDLFLFDGRYRLDPIYNITLEYQKITQIKDREKQEDKTEQWIERHDIERLVVDRKTESIEYIQNSGTQCMISHKYSMEGKISNLLDEINTQSLFCYVEGNPFHVITIPNEAQEYIITIDFKSKSRRVIHGTFDKKGLPVDFTRFIETVFCFMKNCGVGQIFNPVVYGRIKRCEGDYIYCSVVFEEGSKSYYYIAEHDEFEIGDLVVVPVGNMRQTAVVEIIAIEYFAPEVVPLALDKTKHIMYKYVKEE